MALERK